MAPPSTKWGCLGAQRKGDVVLSHATAGERGGTLPGSGGGRCLSRRCLPNALPGDAQVPRHCQTTDNKQLVQLGFNLKGTSCVCTAPGTAGLRARQEAPSSLDHGTLVCRASASFPVTMARNGFAPGT